ncbi:chloramphenicol resistance protein [Poronia punctata]|nr:chloramphenicol resistance protein [Poronia punctata]
MASAGSSPPFVSGTHEQEKASHDSELSVREDAESTDNDDEGGRDVEETLSRVSSGPPYTVFSPGMKRWIIAMNCVSAFVSPITANIYFPALPALARDLGVGIDRINLTLTTYMIFQGLAPTVFGDLGDVAGRRPAFIIAFTIYLGANIGLALQRDFAALLVLRMLQSSGSSGTIALVYAVVADIAPSSERGKWMGIVGAGLTIGPAIGPVIGGLLSAYLGWPWIFWFLVILTTVWIIPYILTVPETARKVVGNGSIPPQGWNMTLIDYLRFRNQARDRQGVTGNHKIPIPNPLNTLRVLRDKEMAMILFYNAALYVCFMTVTATLGTQLQEIYGYDQLTTGLLYLPLGAATTISSVGGGFIADWNFRRIAKQLGIKVDRKRGNDMADFPVEKARIQLIAPLLFVGTGASIGYGWSLERQVSVAVPLVLSFFVGLCVTGPFQILNLLLIDSYPEAPATATAANNLVRCLAGAGATAAVEPIIRAIGRGWAFTIFALIFTIPSPMLWIIVKRGPEWRRERIERMRKKEEKQKVEIISNEELSPPIDSSSEKKSGADR